jgi:hypothetical protein
MTISSNVHDCGGMFPCAGIYGNQQGDYEGLASFGGVSHPIWTVALPTGERRRLQDESCDGRGFHRRHSETSIRQVALGAADAPAVKVSRCATRNERIVG